MIEQYYRENSGRQVKLLERILKGDKASAEDVVQEAYCRAIKYSDTFKKSGGSMDKWFTSILYRCLNDHRASSMGIIKEPLHKHQNIPSEVDYKNLLENMGVISKMVSEWDKEFEKQILDYFFLKGYTAKEIEQTVGFNCNRIYKVCSAFRKRLKEDNNVNL